MQRFVPHLVSGFKELGKDILHLLPLLGISTVFMIVVQMVFGTVCLSKAWFGIPCPACGMTRATILLLQGRIQESLSMHPLVILVFLGLIIYVIDKYFVKKYRKLVKCYALVTLFIIFTFYFYRMFNLFPGEEPMVIYRDSLLVKAIIKFK